MKAPIASRICHLDACSRPRRAGTRLASRLAPNTATRENSNAPATAFSWAVSRDVKAGAVPPCSFATPSALFPCGRRPRFPLLTLRLGGAPGAVAVRIERRVAAVAGGVRVAPRERSQGPVPRHQPSQQLRLRQGHRPTRPPTERGLDGW